MTRFRKPDVDRLTPIVPGLPPDVKKKIPTIDDLMRRAPPLEDWRKFLPLPAPQDRDDPFGPVPIIPTPIEVDPPSRPPMWRHGPPYITYAPTQEPLLGWLSAQFGLPGGISPTNTPPRRVSGGLAGLIERSGGIDPSAPDTPPAGGLVALLQEHLRNNRERSD